MPWHPEDVLAAGAGQLVPAVLLGTGPGRFGPPEPDALDSADRAVVQAARGVLRQCLAAERGHPVDGGLPLLRARVVRRAARAEAYRAAPHRAVPHAPGHEEAQCHIWGVRRSKRHAVCRKTSADVNVRMSVSVSVRLLHSLSRSWRRQTPQLSGQCCRTWSCSAREYSYHSMAAKQLSCRQSAQVSFQASRKLLLSAQPGSAFFLGP